MVKLRKCRLDDIKNIRHLQPPDWSDITFYFKFYCTHDFCYPFVAVCDNKILGVANATLNGITGWLAHIIVAEEYRRGGIGYLLTEHLIGFLHHKGCRSQLLIATEMGEEMYRKFGFKPVSCYLFFENGILKQNSLDVHIRRYRESDLNTILYLDQQASGENRKNMIKQFLENAFVYHSKLEIQGFFLQDFGEGMIVASDNIAGIALLKFKHSIKKCKTVLPVESKSAIDFLSSNGFKTGIKVLRMVLGENIQWKPELIFSRSGGFYG